MPLRQMQIDRGGSQIGVPEQGLHRGQIGAVFQPRSAVWRRCCGTRDRRGFAGCGRQHRYVLHDRDAKFCAAFRAVLASGNVHCLALPPRSPNLNAFAERWVRSVKQECISKLILFGEVSLRRALNEFLQHYHAERHHQGKGNVLLFPSIGTSQSALGSPVRCRQRLGGLVNYYSRAA
jgi:hypothetical protein